MTRNISIIGDRFMLPGMFDDALREACGRRVATTLHELAWPDEPMEHGYRVPGMDGLKEYMGVPDDIVARIGDAEILVTHLAPLSSSMMERLPGLKCVAVSRGGPVNVDMAAARAHGIRVVNTPGRNASAVAEFTIGAILALTRNIVRGHDALRQGVWRGDLYRADEAGMELCDMTVGVIGYGNIGASVVRLLRAFDCRILVADPLVAVPPGDMDDKVRQVDVDTLLEQSDLVTLHARVTPQTEGFMNEGAFARMKLGAWFVNTARGPLVDYDALAHALDSGRLRGAMLETFDVEPVPAEWPLLSHPDVVLTPHIAGASIKTVRDAATRMAEEVRRYIDGEPPLNPC